MTFVIETSYNYQLLSCYMFTQESIAPLILAHTTVFIITFTVVLFYRVCSVLHYKIIARCNPIED